MDIAGLVLGYIAVIGGLSIAPLVIVLNQRNDRWKHELEHIERHEGARVRANAAAG